MTLNLIFAGCASDDAAGEDGGSSDPVLRTIAGNSAIGRPASWSNNCLAEACARADSDGNYLLLTEVAASALLWSDIPFADGSSQQLFSRYRLDDAITTSLVNINPSTHTILDIWSMTQEGQSIDQCANDAACEASLLASFTEEVEGTIISAMDELLGDAWPAERNPFTDVYVADPEDPLDAMHDTLQFVVTETDLAVYNNNGELLTSAPLNRIVLGLPMTDFALTSAQYTNARALPPESATPNAITISATLSPSQPSTPPVALTVNASASTSPNGELMLSHDLTLASGTTTTFSGEIVSTDITEPGSHVWVITGTDTTGASRTQGFVISVLSTDTEEEATFGGEGSCITPAEELDANTWNVCQEVQNGATSQCDTINTTSIALVESPAPCAHQEQNDGALLGLCTLLVNEIRIFFYENPARPNNVETFAEKQARFAAYCADTFEGDWATSP